MAVKAVTHIHSEWSYDGNWELSRIAFFFAKLGYDLVLMTEHDRTFDDKRWEDYQKACFKASTKKTLLVPGMEYSDPDNIVHILVWGVSAFLGKNQETGSLLQKATEKNGICVLAHPGRLNAWKQLDKSWVPLLRGIEFWNRKFDGIAPGQEAMDLLEANKGIAPFAGLDFHRSNQLFPLTMRIEINGDLSRESVFQSLRKSQFRPIAFGLTAGYFMNGFAFSLLKNADKVRRSLSKIIRS